MVIVSSTSAGALSALPEKVRLRSFAPFDGHWQGRRLDKEKT
jgi:hypothetical protein